MYCGIKITNIQSQRGFTMLEALLTLFVLTIGVLGVAGLQIQGMRSGGMAMQRTVVLMKTQEIIDRMRINRGVDGVNLAVYAAGVGSNASCNAGNVCDGATMAANDLFLWQQDLAAMLPSLTGTQIVAVPGANTTAPYSVTVTVTWNTSDGTAAPLNLSYSVNVQI